MAEPLQSIVLRPARLEAFKHPMVAPAPFGFHGGPVLASPGQDRFRHTRYKKPVDVFDPDAVFGERLDGRYVYGGMVYHHFGHVMAEMVSRILPSKLLADGAEWLFVTFEEDGRHSLAELSDWQRGIYQFLGLDLQRARIVDRNTVVEELRIVEPGSDLGHGPKDAYLDVLDEYTDARLNWHFGETPRPEKLYVSRAADVPRGGYLGEHYLEMLLAAEGFTVHRPETLRIEEQMDFYRKAAVVIFPEGSAVHGTELMGRRSLGRVALVPRRDDGLVMFERVLRPRSRDFNPLPFSHYLGTIVRHPGHGTLMEHLGVTLFDFDTLAGRLRDLELAKLPTASRRDYLAAAEADLMVYLERGITEPMPGDPDLEERKAGVVAAFRTATAG